MLSKEQLHKVSIKVLDKTQPITSGNISLSLDGWVVGLVTDFSFNMNAENPNVPATVTLTLYSDLEIL